MCWRGLKVGKNNDNYVKFLVRCMQSCACKLKHACERSLAETSRDIPHDVSVASERVGARLPGVPSPRSPRRRAEAGAVAASEDLKAVKTARHMCVRPATMDHEVLLAQRLLHCTYVSLCAFGCLCMRHNATRREVRREVRDLLVRKRHQVPKSHCTILISSTYQK